MPWSSWTTRSSTARSVNAVSGAPRWYFGRRSERRRAPKISCSVRTTSPSAGIVKPLEQSRRVDDDPRRGAEIRQQPRITRGGRLHRQDDELLERAGRALRRRVEEPDRLDLVAEELDARGRGLRGREDVDDAAARRPLP